MPWSEIDSLLRYGLALGNVEAAGIDRPFARRRPGILHDQDIATRLRPELSFEVGIGMEQHRARRAQPAVDQELALQHVPDLGEAVIVLGMVRAGLEPQDAGVGFG